MLLSKIQISKIIEMYYEDIHNYCHARTHDKHIADDLTQDTFLLLINKASTLVDDNIRSWLYSTATNKIKQHYEKKSIRAKHEQDEIYLSLIRYDFDNFSLDFELEADEYTLEQIEDIKDTILDSLSAEDKKLYIEIYVNRKQHKEIARELGITPKAANVRAFRLKQKILKLTKGILGAMIIVFTLYEKYL